MKYITALNLLFLGFFISLFLSPQTVLAAASLSGTTTTTDIFLGGNSSIIGARWENVVPEAEANDTIFFKVAIYNEGDTPANNLKVKVDFSTTPGNQVANLHLTADEVTEVTDTVTVPVPENLHLSHTPGRAVIITKSGATRVTSGNDTLTTEGLNIGTSLPGRDNRIDVIFTARLRDVSTSIVTPNPTTTEAEATPTDTPPTPTPIAYGYAIAESGNILDTISTAQAGTISAPLTFPATIPHTFTNSEVGTKTLFVKFFYTNGTTQTRQQSLNYAPPPTSTPPPTITPTPTPTNLLQNPGFEQPMAGNWRCVGAVFDINFDCRQTAGKSGDYSIGPSPRYKILQEVNLRPDSVYCASGFVKVETSQTQNITSAIGYRDSSGNFNETRGIGGSISVFNNNDWTPFKISLPVPQTFTEIPKAMVLYNNVGAGFFVDDLSLTEGACQ